MKIEDLQPTVVDTIKKIKDSHMQKYIDEAIASKYMPLRHNTSKNEQTYQTTMHERDGMIHGDILYIEFIGEMMDLQFGHNYRSKSVYTTFYGDKQYGDNSYIVLPYGGEYTMCYSEEVHDMYHQVPKIKDNAFMVVYKHIKAKHDKEVLDIWDGMDYELVQKMKVPFTDYYSYLLNAGVDKAIVSELLDLFSSEVMKEYSDILATYKVTNSLSDAYADVGTIHNPIIEVMLTSPRYFMVSYDYIMTNYRDVDYFLDAIK